MHLLVFVCDKGKFWSSGWPAVELLYAIFLTRSSVMMQACDSSLFSFSSFRIPEHASINPAFSLPRGKALREHWQTIPPDTDVLITHGPPWGHCDLTCKGYNVGCKDLLEEVRDRVKPKIHVFGHLHEGINLREKG